MRHTLLILFTCFFIFTNCSIKNDNTTPDVVRVYYNLINVSGGIEGVDDYFELGTITWTFNDETGILTVVNENIDNTKQDGLDSGDYNYSVLNSGGNSFLIVDSNELGSLEYITNNLIINGNETSEGSGADGFIYTFSLTTVIE